VCFVTISLNHKKDDLFKKIISMEKVNIPQHGTKEMYDGYTFQVSYVCFVVLQWLNPQQV